MPIVWSVTRDTTEESTPLVVDGIAPFEGGILRRLDDDQDSVRFCFYLLTRAPRAGQYAALWRVRNPGNTEDLSDEDRINEVHSASSTEMLLIPPKVAPSQSVLPITLFDEPAPSDILLISKVKPFPSNIADHFSPSISVADYLAKINGCIFQVNQPAS